MLTGRNVSVGDFVKKAKATVEGVSHCITLYPIGLCRFIAYTLEKIKTGIEPIHVSAERRVNFLRACEIGDGEAGFVQIFDAEVPHVGSERLGRFPPQASQ